MRIDSNFDRQLPGATFVQSRTAPTPMIVDFGTCRGAFGNTRTDGGLVEYCWDGLVRLGVLTPRDARAHFRGTRREITLSQSRTLVLPQRSLQGASAPQRITFGKWGEQ